MATGRLRLTIVNGRREPFPKPVEVRLIDNDQRRVHWATHKTPDIMFEIPVTGGPRDRFLVLAGADDHRQVGQSGVLVKEGAVTEIALMLLHKRSVLEFKPIGALALVHQKLDTLVKAFLKHNFQGEDQSAYDRLQQANAEGLATLLNVASGFDGFGGDQTMPPSMARHPLTFVTELTTLEPDRFFANVDVGMVTWLASDSTTFGPAPSLLHKGADFSFKERRYAEGNVQFTFSKTSDPKALVLDSDVDLFGDVLSHNLVEVLPNEASGSHTDPKRAYAFRWMSAQRAKPQSGLDFDPPFTVSAM